MIALSSHTTLRRVLLLSSLVTLLSIFHRTEAFLSSKPIIPFLAATPKSVGETEVSTTTSGSNTVSSSRGTTELHASSSSSSSSTSKYKKVFVAGGSKGVGRAIVEKLSSRGIQVVALVRNEETQNELNGMDGVTAILGDAFEQKSVENAMDGCDAAITTLGGSTEDRRVDYEGNSNVIESAGILGISRIILVTSIGCGSSKEAAPPSVFEVLKNVLAEKEKAENILIDYYTNVNWTIIRPGGLITAPMTGQALLTEDNTAIGSIHREDVANLVIQALDSPKTERKVLSAIDPSVTSSVAVAGKVIPAFAL